MITLILLGRKFLSWKNKSLPVQRHWVSEKTFAYVHQTENGWFARIMAIQGLAQNHLAPSFSLCTSWNRALQTMTNGSSRKSDRRCANRTGISSWIQRACCTCCSSDLNRSRFAQGKFASRLQERNMHTPSIVKEANFHTAVNFMPHADTACRRGCSRIERQTYKVCSVSWRALFL